MSELTRVLTLDVMTSKKVRVSHRFGKRNAGLLRTGQPAVAVFRQLRRLHDSGRDFLLITDRLGMNDRLRGEDERAWQESAS